MKISQLKECIATHKSISHSGLAKKVIRFARRFNEDADRELDPVERYALAYILFEEHTLPAGEEEFFTLLRHEIWDDPQRQMPDEYCPDMYCATQVLKTNGFYPYLFDHILGQTNCLEIANKFVELDNYLEIDNSVLEFLKKYAHGMVKAADLLIALQTNKIYLSEIVSYVGSVEIAHDALIAEYIPVMRDLNNAGILFMPGVDSLNNQVLQCIAALGVRAGAEILLALNTNKIFVPEVLNYFLSSKLKSDEILHRYIPALCHLRDEGILFHAGSLNIKALALLVVPDKPVEGPDASLSFLKKYAHGDHLAADVVLTLRENRIYQPEVMEFLLANNATHEANMTRYIPALRDLNDEGVLFNKGSLSKKVLELIAEFEKPADNVIIPCLKKYAYGIQNGVDVLLSLRKNKIYLPEIMNFVLNVNATHEKIMTVYIPALCGLNNEGILFTEDKLNKKVLELLAVTDMQADNHAFLKKYAYGYGKAAEILLALNANKISLPPVMDYILSLNLPHEALLTIHVPALGELNEAGILFNDGKLNKAVLDLFVLTGMQIPNLVTALKMLKKEDCLDAIAINTISLFANLNPVIMAKRVIRQKNPLYDALPGTEVVAIPEVTTKVEPPARASSPPPRAESPAPDLPSVLSFFGPRPVEEKPEQPDPDRSFEYC